jgi:hypothetical protein
MGTKLNADKDAEKRSHMLLAGPKLLFTNVKIFNQVWRCMPMIPVLRRLRKEDCEFEASLGNTERPCLKKKKKRKKEV